MRIVIKSVGTKAPFSSGTIAVDATGLIVTLSGSIWDINQGEGDKLVIGAETLYVETRNDSTRLTLQSASTHAGQTGLSYSIRRSYSSFEVACIGEARNLVTADESCKIVAYKESNPGSINFGLRTSVYPWVTDSTHTIEITAAVCDRHIGMAGTGVVLDGRRIYVEHLSYVTISWLELKNLYGDYVYAIMPYADYFTIHNCIIHDFSNGMFLGNGQGEGCAHAEVYRNIVYNCTGQGIHNQVRPANGIHHVYDNTIYNCGVYGFYDHDETPLATSGVIYKNNISMGCGRNWYTVPADPNPDCTNNMGEYADTLPGHRIPGANPQVSTPEDEFINITSGFENLHLRIGAVAIGNAATLAAPYDVDVDGDAVEPPWDIGADQKAFAPMHGASVCDCIVYGQSAANIRKGAGISGSFTVLQCVLDKGDANSDVIGISFSDRHYSKAPLVPAFNAFVGGKPEYDVKGDVDEDNAMYQHFNIGQDSKFSRMLSTWTNSLWSEVGIDPNGDYATVFVDRTNRDYHVVDINSPLYMRGLVNRVVEAYPGSNWNGDEIVAQDLSGYFFFLPEIDIGALQSRISFEFTGARIRDVVEDKLNYFTYLEKDTQDNGEYVTDAGDTLYRVPSSLVVRGLDEVMESVKLDYSKESKVFIRLHNVKWGDVSGRRRGKLVATLSATLEFRTSTLVLEKVSASYKQLLSRCPGDDNYIFHYDEQERTLQVYTGAPAQRVVGATV